jgi:hypothetical protein
MNTGEGLYKTKMTKLAKSKRMLKYAEDIIEKKYDCIYTAIIPLKKTPTDLGDGIERWEFKVFIGEDEPRKEEYINIIAKASELKYEIIEKE